MRDTTIIIITAIICITILEIANIVFLRVDGSILSSIVGAISSLVTWFVSKLYYSSKQENESGEKNA